MCALQTSKIEGLGGLGQEKWRRWWAGGRQQALNSWLTRFPKATACPPTNPSICKDPLQAHCVGSFPIRNPQLLPPWLPFCSAPIFSFSFPHSRGPCLTTHASPTTASKIGWSQVMICRTLPMCYTSETQKKWIFTILNWEPHHVLGSQLLTYNRHL